MARRFAVCFSFLTVIVSTGYAHSVNTHKNIAFQAVAYLKKNVTGYANLPVETLQKLYIGAVREDVDAPFPRFMFHFLPALNEQEVEATCSSIDWAFEE